MSQNVTTFLNITVKNLRPRLRRTEINLSETKEAVKKNWFEKIPEMADATTIRNRKNLLYDRILCVDAVGFGEVSSFPIENVFF